MVDVSVVAKVEDSCMDLPPGFRFHPTDEEIITHYLSPKVLNHGFSARAIGAVDLNKCEPWDLPSKAKMGEKEWYFFCQRDRKYPTGTRTNRATEAGYWKATGKDKEIYRGRSVLVGMKKTLVFYRGRAPKGEKTNWVMHEYRLDGRTPLHNLPKSAKDEWVVCRVFHKNTGVVKKIPAENGLPRLNSFEDDLADLREPSNYSGFSTRPGPSYSSLINDGQQEGHGFKGFPSYNYPTIMSMEDPNNYSINNQVSQSSKPLQSSSVFYSQLPPPPNPMYGVPGSASSMEQLHREQAFLLRALATSNEASNALRTHCKAEQFSNQSMVSQDTGLSTDRNTEISSVLSKYDDLDDPSSTAGAALDLDNMWNY